MVRSLLGASDSDRIEGHQDLERHIKGMHQGEIADFGILAEMEEHHSDAVTCA